MPVWEAGGLRYSVKARWNPDNHPRYPKGHPRGGQFIRVGDVVSLGGKRGHGRILAAGRGKVRAARDAGDEIEVPVERLGDDPEFAEFAERGRRGRARRRERDARAEGLYSQYDNDVPDAPWWSPPSPPPAAPDRRKKRKLRDRRPYGNT